MKFENTQAFAQQLDATDALRKFCDQFHIPEINGKRVIYLAGNSLGLLPKKARDYAEQEFLDWQHHGVEAHFHAKNPWLYYHHFCEEALAKIVGADKNEVVAMGSLTANLHLLMVSFYRPTKTRYKIMMEANAFPSDQYAMETQVRYHGLDPDDAVIEMKPREGEFTLRTEDILQAIKDNADQLATIMFGGVNYLSGQLFDMKAITEAGHAAGAMVGFDLAHTVGNVPVKLHEWQVDFACWCSYKYLNSGPGGVAGIFVHEKHGNNSELPRFAGWWGNEEATRFKMEKGFHPQAGAAGWQVSNAPVFPMAIHRASLELYDEAGMGNLRNKSLQLTAYLEFIIDDFNNNHPSKTLQIITPKDPAWRGCQLSLIASANGKEIFNRLTEACVITDWREPNVIRMAPVPLYNSFEDVWNVGRVLREL
ncbi:MAG: kynureninase [Chitinophagales bacterium]|nr:kynureninase [Chitinophagales bacterium]